MSLENRYVELKVSTPKGWSRLIETLVSKALYGEIGYPARIVVKDYRIRKNGLHIHGELQVIVNYSLYIDVMKRYNKPRGDNITGVNVNVDRLDAVVIDRYGNNVSYKTFWLKDATFMGVRRKRAWGLIGEQIHALLKWLYSQGVSTISLENPEIIGYLRYY